MTRLMICNMGMGFTAPSNVFVRKSQKILGQKKPWIAADIWSGVDMLASIPLFHTVGKVVGGGDEVSHTDGCGQDDESRPVVLNKFSHLDVSMSAFSNNLGMCLSIPGDFLQ